MLQDENGKRYPSFQWEEHVTMCSEPGGQYLSHFTPKGKDAKSIADEIYAFLVEHGLDKTLIYIGGDSTNVNTGFKGGIMFFLEQLLGHRLIRIVCEIHTNELPTRHVIIEIDGPTTGTNSFSGIFPPFLLFPFSTFPFFYFSLFPLFPFSTFPFFFFSFHPLFLFFHFPLFYYFC